MQHDLTRSRCDTYMDMCLTRSSVDEVASCAQAGNAKPPGWTTPATLPDSVFSPTTADLGKSIGGVHSFGAPIHVYPLYENGFRAHRAQTLKDNNDESAALYAEFAKVAAQNEHSWNYGTPPASKEDIGTVSPRNRMICLPCV